MRWVEMDGAGGNWNELSRSKLSWVQVVGGG